MRFINEETSIILDASLILFDETEKLAVKYLFRGFWGFGVLGFWGFGCFSSYY